MTTEVKDKQLSFEEQLEEQFNGTDDEQLGGTGKDSWDGQGFFTGNRAWGIAPNLKTVCLGSEFEVQAYLKGGTLPRHINQVAIETLKEIKELEERGNLYNAGTRDNKVESSRTKRPIRTGSIRAGLTTNTQYQPVNTRYIKARQRVPGGKAQLTTSSVSN